MQKNNLSQVFVPLSHSMLSFCLSLLLIYKHVRLLCIGATLESLNLKCLPYAKTAELLAAKHCEL